MYGYVIILCKPPNFISAIPTLYHYNSCEYYYITCTRDSNEHYCAINSTSDIILTVHDATA